MRVEPAAPIIPRVATQDTHLGGCPIPAGASIQVAIGAANRDPAERIDPDLIDFRRRQRHLTFGAGPPRCFGSHLAGWSYGSPTKSGTAEFPSIISRRESSPR